MDQLTKSLNSDLIGNFNGLPDGIPVRRTLKKMKSFSIPVLFKSNLIGKIKDAQVALVQLEGKLDFFKFSDDKNPLKRDVMSKIEAAQDVVAQLKDKKKRIDLAMKELARAEAAEAAEAEKSESDAAESAE